MPTRNPLPRSFTKEFLQFYRTKECLWRKKHPLYRDAAAREQAEEELCLKLREVEPGATIFDAVRRIENLRVHFRREFVKLLETTQPGYEGAVYVPRAWYFPLLAFLYEDEYPNLPALLQSIGLPKPENINATDDTKSTAEIKKSEKRSRYSMLIRLYKRYPCLWNPKHPDHKNWQTRIVALRKIFNQYQQSFPVAHHKAVCRRLQLFTKTQTRDINKLLEERRRGRLHRVKTWYFAELKYMNKYVCKESLAHLLRADETESAGEELDDAQQLDDDDDDTAMDQDTSPGDGTKDRELARLLRRFPLLWYPKHPHHKKTALKVFATHLLLDQYKKIDPTITYATLSDKVKNIIHAHKTELTNLLKSRCYQEEYTVTRDYFSEMRYANKYVSPAKMAHLLRPEETEVVDECEEYYNVDRSLLRDDSNGDLSEQGESHTNKQKGLQLISLYKQHPVLWDRDHPDFKSHAEDSPRQTALTTILHQYANVEPSITLKKLEERLKQLFNSQRAELSGMLGARMTGEEYEAGSCWFRELSFLNRSACPRMLAGLLRPEETVEVEQQLHRVTDAENYDQIEQEEPDMKEVKVEYTDNAIYSEYLDNQNAHFKVYVIPPLPNNSNTVRNIKEKTKRTKDLSIEESDIIRKKLPLIQKNKTKRGKFVGLSSKDRLDVLSKNMAARLRKLEKTQRIRAEKIIADILYNAELKLLNPRAKLMINSDKNAWL